MVRDECLRPSSRVAEIREPPLPKCADSDEIEYTTVSVGAAVMSRKVLPRLYLCLLAFFGWITRKANANAHNCLEFDVDELEDYLSKLDLGSVPTIDMMVGQFKCPVTALPFGALKSDWARLLLLQRAQPEESTLREKLGRLFRILVIAYFQMEERFDVTGTEPRTTDSVNVSTYEATPVADLKNDTEPDTSLTNSEETNGITENFIPTVPFGDRESFVTSKVEATTITTSSDITRKDADESDSVRNPISLTTAMSSPVDATEGTDTREKETVEASLGTVSLSITVSSNISTEEREHQEALNNYLDNDTVHEDSSRLNEVTVKQAEDINGGGGDSLRKEMQSTTEDFIEDESSTSDLIKESTVDRFRTDGSTRNGFIGVESSVSGVVAEGNTIDNVDDKIQLVTLPTFKSDIPSSTVTPWSNKSSITASSIAATASKTYAGYQTSTLRDVEEKTRVPTPIADTRTSTQIVERKTKTGGRGDSPIFDVSTGTENEGENTIDEDEGSKLSTVQYLDTTHSDLPESANTSGPEITDVKTTTYRNRIRSDEISENDATGSVESFARNRSDDRKDIFQVFKKTPSNLPSSTLYRNKIRKPSVSERPPVDNEFWKYIVISQNVTQPTSTALTPTWKLSDRTERTNVSAGPSSKSKKRGSLNSNVEKNFRWFYGFGQEDKVRSSDNRPQIYVRCNEEKHKEGN